MYHHHTVSLLDVPPPHSVTAGCTVTTQCHCWMYHHHTVSLLDVPPPHSVTAGCTVTTQCHCWMYRHHIVSLLDVPPHSVTAGCTVTTQCHCWMYRHHTVSLLDVHTTMKGTLFQSTRHRPVTGQMKVAQIVQTGSYSLPPGHVPRRAPAQDRRVRPPHCTPEPPAGCTSYPLTSSPPGASPGGRTHHKTTLQLRTYQLRTHIRIFTHRLHAPPTPGPAPPTCLLTTKVASFTFPDMTMKQY